MSALIRVQLSTDSVQLRPGEQANLNVTVQNMSEIVGLFQIALGGIDPEWWSVSREDVGLFPQEQTQVRVTIHPPSGPETRAGTYDVQIGVSSCENPSERTVRALEVEVLPLSSLDLVLRPERQSGRRVGVFHLQVGNQGNTDLVLQLEASDPGDACLYTFDPALVVVPATQERVVRLQVRPKVPPRDRERNTYTFAVTARPAQAPHLAASVQGEWRCLPLRPRNWPLVAAVLVVVVGASAAAIALLRPGSSTPATGQGRTQEPATVRPTGPAPTAEDRATPQATPVPASPAPTHVPTAEPENLSSLAVASASSVFPPDSWGPYDPPFAVDGDLGTPWVEGVEGPGIGEWIHLAFPETVVVERIGIDVGYDRNEDVFFANHRLKRATVRFSDGQEIELTFSDKRGMQVMGIPRVETSFVRIVIEEVYVGTWYDDTCVGEIEIWGHLR